jgi:hypothetical protein
LELIVRLVNELQPRVSPTITTTLFCITWWTRTLWASTILDYPLAATALAWPSSR